MLWTMGGGEIIRIGASGFTPDELWWLLVPALVGGAIPLVPWARWRFREWRIARAVAKGDHDHAELLALDHEYDEPPRSLRQILAGAAFLLVGMPALFVFQENFMDELEHVLGEGRGFLAVGLTSGFVTGCAYLWDRARRNMMSPEELAALEEEEEHRRWMQSIDGDAMPGLIFAVAGGAAILTAIYFLAEAITPG